MKTPIIVLVLLFATNTQSWDFAIPDLELKTFSKSEASQISGLHEAQDSKKTQTSIASDRIAERAQQKINRKVSSEVFSANNGMKQDCRQKLNDQVSKLEEVFRNSIRTQVPVGPWFYLRDSSLTPDSDSSIEGKFYSALAKAHLLIGYPVKIEKDVNSAIELLNEVHQADPGNSAPLLYLAILEKLEGRNDVALSHLRKAQMTTYFNSYLTKISKSIFAQVKSPSDYVVATGIVSQIPVPDYNILKEFILVNKQPAFGVQLMQDGLNENNVSEFMDWVGIEYAIGRASFNKIFDTNEFPDFTTLMKKKKAKQKVTADKIMEVLDATCDVDSLWPYLSDLIPSN